MIINTEEEFLELVSQDREMMSVLRIVESLDLPDWWVCAGFVRSKIWDIQHGFSAPTQLPDVDVIYFDGENQSEMEDLKLEKLLKQIREAVPWSVKNQARMHTVNGVAPYTSSVDAISKFPETATSLGLKLDQNGSLKLVAPHGLDDALHMKVRPTPHFVKENMLDKYKDRVSRKRWSEKWWKVEVEQI
ncbi:nucleotidyltransferase family protein [Virgibacillus flavescens]|uniref:nucleotidyltransferase family protein n=1 Tax=Virgibacillus flavescens TaxID=1611422 RepID=UPI003D325115